MHLCGKAFLREKAATFEDIKSSLQPKQELLTRQPGKLYNETGLRTHLSRQVFLQDSNRYLDMSPTLSTHPTTYPPSLLLTPIDASSYHRGCLQLWNNTRWSRCLLQILHLTLEHPEPPDATQDRCPRRLSGFGEITRKVCNLLIAFGERHRFSSQHYFTCQPLGTYHRNWQPTWRFLLLQQ